MRGDDGVQDSPPPQDDATWRRVDQAFRLALEQPEAERENWARERYADQPELLDQLLRLLAVDAPSARLFDAAGDVLDAAVAQVQGEEAREVGGLVGRHIGHYRLEALLATGGMGAVYRAVRDDGQFQQTVAVKILPGWATDEQTVARLRAERQILAELHHPAITHLLDGGETPDGYPYIVTEFIDGVALDQWLVERRPSLELRLNLFVRVAQAVQYAHEHDILHRDLKPSNILVDSADRPHLLDFGIAKLLEAGGRDWTAPRTATGFTPMTPEYASPEQRAGTVLGTASDIYQLGLLLFELLTGMEARRHGDRAGGTTRPSTVLAMAGREARGLPKGLEAQRLARQLKGDLDTIVLKALRDDPGERYTTASGMADDIRSYLGGRPIAARPETAWAATRRLARHHPAAAALSVGLVLVLAASSAGLYLYAHEVETQRDEAMYQARRAEAGRTTLLGLFERTDPLRADAVGGRDATVWGSLDAAVAEARRELAAQPDIQVELLATLADLYLKAGDTEKAKRLMAEVVERYQQLGEGFEPQLAVQQAEYAGLVAGQDRATAAPLMKRALAVVPGLRAGHPEAAVSVLMDAGYFEYDAANYEAALTHFSSAGEIATEVKFDDASQRIEILFSQANVLRALGRYEQSDALLREALALGEQSFGPDHPRLAGVLNSMGALARVTGQTDRAIEINERLVALMSLHYGDQYGGLQSARNNLALAYGNAGRAADEQRILREVIDARRAQDGPEGSLTLAGSLKNLGSSYQASGESAAALEVLAQSEALYDRHAPPESPYHALPHFTRGLVHLDAEEYGAAEPEFREALKILEPVMGEAHFQVQTTRCMLAEALQGQGRVREARALAPAALDGMLASGDPGHPYTSRCRATVELLDGVKA